MFANLKWHFVLYNKTNTKIVSECDQDIPQSQTRGAAGKSQSHQEDK